MSIASEISRLSSNISDSLDAVAAKGVTVPSDSNSDDLPGLIALIEQSSGGDSGGTIYQDTDGYLHLSEDNKNVISIVDTLDTAGGTIRTIDAKVDSGGADREDLTASKDVDFIDFDGRLLYSYTASEFLELTELPPNPSYPGLVAQGWNWTLTDAKEFVAEYGSIDIGQMYITDDGKTRLYISVDNTSVSGRNIATIKFKQSIANGVSVDWGDGSEVETYASTSLTDYTHAYTVDGNYVISLEVTSGTLTLQGTWNTSIMGPQAYNAATLNKVEIGSGVLSINGYAFLQQKALNYISIPMSVTSISGSSVFNSTDIKALVVPIYCANFGGQYMFSESTLRRISFPNSITTFSASAFGQPHFLRRAILPSSFVFWGAVFQNAYLMKKCIMPEGISDPLSANAFKNCRCLITITIPTTITTLQEAFGDCSGLKEIHMKATTPPTLSSKLGSGFPSDFAIYVPYSADHSVLTAYQEATNWSTYASQMQEEPQ